jgi:DNA-binding transcriptional MerR regulator
MNIAPHQSSHDLPIYGEEIHIRYSIEVIAELTGIEPQTILEYQAKGFIRATASGTENEALFDVESLRQLRRIEHLRRTYEVNDVGLKLILGLLHETECLREERRQMRR